MTKCPRAHPALDAGRGAGQGAAAWRDASRCGRRFLLVDRWTPPAGRGELWPGIVALLKALAENAGDLPAQVGRVREFYGPLLETNYDNSAPRLRDLEQLEQIASRYRSRQRMLMEMALDPPNSTQDFAGPPVLDDDYLVLSTIHSAKGLEWDAVYVSTPLTETSLPICRQKTRKHRRGIAAVLCRPYAGEELALRALPAALLPLLSSRRQRPLRHGAADAVSA